MDFYLLNLSIELSGVIEINKMSGRTSCYSQL